MSECTQDGPEYKIFFLDEQGKIKKAKDLKAITSDADAISMARSLLDGRRLELFEGCRFVLGFSGAGVERNATGIGKADIDLPAAPHSRS